MQEVIKLLNDKINILTSEYEKDQNKKEQINNDIDALVEVLEHPETFDDNDINELSYMLSDENRLKLKEIRPYLKIFERFSTQPQVVVAKKIYNEIKINAVNSMRQEQKEFDSIFYQTEKLLNFMKSMVKKLAGYNKDIYISAEELYKLTEYLNNGNITQEIIEFYKSVLINNCQFDDTILPDIKDNNQIKGVLSYFVKKIKQNNRTCNNSQLKNDKEILGLLKYILNIDRKKTYIYDLRIINLLHEEIKDENILNKIKFYFHLCKVNIDLEKSQKDFLICLQQMYQNKIDCNMDKLTIEKNNELIGSLNDTKKFCDVSLLDDVFKLNHINPLHQLQIISSIVASNQKKVDYNEKQKLKIK